MYPDIPSPFLVEIVEDETTADALKRSAEEARQREIEGLAAQKAMNVATQSIEEATVDMRNYALASTISVWIGTFLLIVTLILTWMANRAAQAAVRVTRETGRDQARAYVEVDAVKFYWGTKAGQKPEFKISLRNHGATPAKWLQVRQDYRLYTHKENESVPTNFQNLRLPTEYDERWNGLASSENEQLTSGPPIRDAQEMAKCRYDLPRAGYTPALNTHGVIVFGEVRYCTIFNEIYTSQFYFGAASLEAFQANEPEIIDKRQGQNEIELVRLIREIPQSLSRFPVKLDLYQKHDTK
ncbi:hypothetical protein V8352_13470 [Roseovarius sp. D0-M9]